MFEHSKLLRNFFDASADRGRDFSEYDMVTVFY